MIKTFYKNLTIEQINVISFLGVAVLTLFYLLLSNNVATVNYKKIILQKKIDNLRTEIKNLNLELVNKRSIGFLKKSAQDLNLVVSENIQYIKVAGLVAKNP